MSGGRRRPPRPVVPPPTGETAYPPGQVREVRLVRVYGTDEWQMLVCRNARGGVPVTTPEGDPGPLWEVAQLAAIIDPNRAS